MRERLIFCGIILMLLLVNEAIYKPYIVHKTEKAVTERITTKYEAEYQAKLAAAMKKESEINQQALTREREKNETLKTNNDKLAALVDSLRSRASRKGGSANSKTPGSGKTCTGAELSREDSEFLAREAARADRILEERNYYYDIYENARKGLEDLYRN